MNVEEIVLNNTKLIYAAAKKLNVYRRIDEFYSIGMIGLVKGAKTYDKKLGFKLSTYLYKCIYNEMLMEIRNRTLDKQIPEYIVTSISVPTGEDLTLEDTIADTIDIEELIIQKEEISTLYKEISKLSKREQMVINLSFGLNGYKIMKQKDISKMFKVSRSYISKIKLRALKKLRKAMK